MSNVTVKSADWESLVGAVLKQETDDLNTLLTRVDAQNSLNRYYLYVKWQDAGAKRPGPDDPIQDWPPWGFDWFVSYSRFTKDFVEDFVARQSTNPLTILVTDDPAGEVGWYLLEDFFS